MTKKRIPTAAQTVERGYFPLEVLRAMKPLTAAKPPKQKEARK